MSNSKYQENVIHVRKDNPLRENEVYDEVKKENQELIRGMKSEELYEYLVKKGYFKSKGDINLFILDYLSEAIDDNVIIPIEYASDDEEIKDESIEPTEETMPYNISIDDGKGSKIDDLVNKYMEEIKQGDK